MTWLLAALGLASLWWLDRRPVLGWALMVADELAWAWYAVSSSQPAFLVTTVAYGAVALRGLHRAKRVQQST